MGDVRDAGLAGLSAVSRRRPVPDTPDVPAIDVPALSAKLDDARQALWRGELDTAAQNVDTVIRGFSAGPDPIVARSGTDLRAVEASAQSLRGQILEQRNEEPRQVRDAMQRAVNVFRLLAGRQPEAAQTYADYGAALRVLGFREEAEANLREAVRRGDVSPATACRLGGLLLNDGRALEAREVLRKALAVAPGDIETLTLLGDSEYALGRPAAALEHFVDAAGAAHRTGQLQRAWDLYTTALRIDPDRADLHFCLGDVLLHVGVPIEKAIGAFDRALALDPDNVGAKVGKADALRVVGDFDGALALVEEALALDPASAYALAVKGDVLRLQGKHTAALEAVNDSLAVNEQSAWTIGTRGQVLRQLGRLEDARDDLRRSVADDPRLAWAWAELAAVSFELGDVRAAEQAAERALELDGGIPLAVAVRARCFVDTGRGAQALSLLEWLRDNTPDVEWVWVQLADVQRRKGDTAAARKTVDTALRAGLTDPVLLLLHTELSPVGDDPDERATAIRDLDAYLEEATLDLDGLLRAARAFRSLGANDRAIETLNIAAAVQSDASTIWCEKAAAEFDLGRFADVLESLAHVPEVDASVDDLWRRGEAARLLGESAQASRCFRTALEQDPTDLRALSGQIFLSLDHGKPDRARKYAARAMQAHPNHPGALVNAATVELAKQSYASALRLLDRALRGQPDHVDALRCAGGVLLDVGRFDEAASALQRARTRGALDSWTLSALGFAQENVAACGIDGPRAEFDADARKRLKQALDVYQEGVARSPAEPFLSRGVADVLYAMGEKAAARRQYDELVDVVNQAGFDGGSIAVLGWCYFRLGHNHRALRTYASALAARVSSAVDYLDFDLALVALASEGVARGRTEYERTRTRCADLPAARRVGLFAVARNNLAVSAVRGDFVDPVEAWPLVTEFDAAIGALGPLPEAPGPLRPGT